MTPPLPTLCRDCFRQGLGGAPACPACGSPRLLRHPSLFRLAIAHVDADAFFASVEKARRPELAARPVLVGGGARGVVTAACYIARLRGVGSAMPMARALRACPDAVVLRPDFAAYTAVARALRERMLALTPSVQPLSIDEAVLDLSGTERLHGAPPPAVLARFAREVEDALGITVSIGLAANPLLAKLAAGRDKPRGFSVLGPEAARVLAGEPVDLLPGIGPALARRLAARGITRLGQLQALDDRAARRLLGEDGPALAARARGEDRRRVQPGRTARSMGAETTLAGDLSDRAALERALWPLCEKLAGRLREAGLAAGAVSLRLKTASFVRRSRAAPLPCPTVLPDTLFEAARAALAPETDGTAFRLVGLAALRLRPIAEADPPDLADPERSRRVARQAAIDRLRARFGAAAIARGRAAPREPACPRRDSNPRPQD